MIRLIRILSIFLCVVSIGLFAFATFYTNRNSDTGAPVIHMEDDVIKVSIHSDESMLLKGVTAEDKKDGDVTDSLIVEKEDLFFEKGKRKITIAAFDSNNNMTKAERTVVYKDYKSPEIMLEGPLRAPTNNMQQLLEGITVKDCIEGDITDNLQITLVKDATIFSLPGEYKMKMIVSNSLGDVVEVPVTVELYDYALDSSVKKILLSDYIVYTKVGKTIDPQSYLTGLKIRNQEYKWDDQISTGVGLPNSKSDIRIENNVNMEKPGVYEIVYSLEDENAESRVHQIVIVE